MVGVERVNTLSQWKREKKKKEKKEQRRKKGKERTGREGKNKFDQTENKYSKRLFYNKPESLTRIVHTQKESLSTELSFEIHLSFYPTRGDIYISKGKESFRSQISHSNKSFTVLSRSYLHIMYIIITPKEWMVVTGSMIITLTDQKTLVTIRFLGTILYYQDSLVGRWTNVQLMWPEKGKMFSLVRHQRFHEENLNQHKRSDIPKTVSEMSTQMTYKICHNVIRWV